jgi:hypothetical protein
MCGKIAAPVAIDVDVLIVAANSEIKARVA